MLARVVDRYDDVVARTVGDGIGAGFDSATRAVNGAPRMQAENPRLARENVAHTRPAMRIGIAAGDVTFDDDLDPSGGPARC
jgi:class 3 adenylate cyclase